MVDRRYPVRRSRGLLVPALTGLGLLVTLIAGIAIRQPLWRLARWAGHTVNTWLTEWTPAHPRQTEVIVGFAAVALALNWIAHVRGRLRAWIFALVVEAGLWLLFWNGLGIPSLNNLLGLKVAKLTPAAFVVSGVAVIAVTGVVFWFLEIREEWLAYRHKHHIDED